MLKYADLRKFIRTNVMIWSTPGGMELVEGMKMKKSWNMYLLDCKIINLGTTIRAINYFSQLIYNNEAPEYA